jgi:hypothetical protein
MLSVDFRRFHGQGPSVTCGRTEHAFDDEGQRDHWGTKRRIDQMGASRPPYPAIQRPADPARADVFSMSRWLNSKATYTQAEGFTVHVQVDVCVWWHGKTGKKPFGKGKGQGTKVRSTAHQPHVAFIFRSALLSLPRSTPDLTPCCYACYRPAKDIAVSHARKRISIPLSLSLPSSFACRIKATQPRRGR